MTILISGGPGAGKTTLLKELLGAVSPLERIVTVEKGLLELRLEDDPRHPDAPALYTRQANTEGRGAVSARELVELTRRLNPDRVIVGELVEDEALEMLDVASMCKRGRWPRSTPTRSRRCSAAWRSTSPRATPSCRSTRCGA